MTRYFIVSVECQDITSSDIATGVLLYLGCRKLGKSLVVSQLQEWRCQPVRLALAQPPVTEGYCQRDVELLEGIAAGLTQEGIAQQRRLARRTIRNYISELYQRLGAHDMSSAMVQALRLGLIETGREA